METVEIRHRLMKLGTTHLADANKELRVMDSEIRPVRNDLKMVGHAHTVRCKNDFLTVLKALNESVQGEVLVIETCNSRAAVAGELFSLEAARRGLSGIVIDGACRDTATIRTLSIPVYSRSVIPASGSSAGIYETQVPIICGGITVNPGDVIVGDDDGVVVAAKSELLELLTVAEEIQANETMMVRKLEGGECLFDMLNFDEHYHNVERGVDSKLKFKS